jgi:hypothetical protein
MNDINIRMHASGQQKSRGRQKKEDKTRKKKTSFRIRTNVSGVSEIVKKRTFYFLLFIIASSVGCG